MPKRVIHFLGDALRRPRAELTRGQRKVRSAWELGAHCWRVLCRHRAEGMAAELTYRTIFSLIPLVVLGLVMFRVVGGLEDVQSKVEEELYVFFGVPDVAYSQPLPELEVQEGGTVEIVPPPQPPSDGADPAPDAAAAENDAADRGAIAAGDGEQERQQVRASVRRALSELISKISNLDFASIGIIGLLLFIYAAIALTDSVEQVFNIIYDAPSGRPIHLRFAIHWSIITLGTGLLAMSLYLSGQFVDYVSGTSVGAAVKSYLNHALAMLASWVLLFLLYALMPNTKVSVRSAMIGALVAAVLWEAAKLAFQVYVHTALPYSALYGALGLIPVFLFWVYLTWLIVLFGLVWTYTLQTAPSLQLARMDDETEGAIAGDPLWMLPLMVEVARSFQLGETLTQSKLTDRLGLPGRSVRRLCEVLTEAQLLRRSSSATDDLLLPARPPEKITAGEVLRLRLDHASRPEDDPVWDFLDRIRERECEAACKTTLADLTGLGAFQHRG